MVRVSRRAFTLTELLVVILIIFVISVIALPIVVSSLAGRQVSESGRLLQATLAGARDKAIRDGRPSGIRLLPDPAWPLAYVNGQIDPTQPLAYNRVVPIESAPQYVEGLVTIRVGAPYTSRIHNPAGLAVAVPSLVLEQAPTDAQGLPTSPTSWAWNVRVGDKLQLNGAGPWYTIAGPRWISTMPTPSGIANPEGFVNWGPIGTPSPLGVEWLVLTNGLDDNGNGYPDDWFDGFDNDGDGIVDDTPETLANWGYPPGSAYLHQSPGQSFPAEIEMWHGAVARGVASVPYAIRRRPMPGPNARELALPTHMVVDAARSRLPIDPLSGAVEIIINPDGTASPSLPYGVPTSLGMGSAFMHFALVDREDIAPANPPPAPAKSWAVLSLQLGTGRIVVTQDPDPSNPFNPAQQGAP